jgi:hypothetical protein
MEKQTGNVSSLSIFPPPKPIDKSQRQQFVLEFTSSVDITRHFTLETKSGQKSLYLNLPGMLKQSRDEASTDTIDGFIELFIFSRDGKDITYENCYKCIEKYKNVFLKEPSSLNPIIDQTRETPKRAFVLFGQDKIIFEKGSPFITDFQEKQSSLYFSVVAHLIIQVRII